MKHSKFFWLSSILTIAVTTFLGQASWADSSGLILSKKSPEVIRTSVLSNGNLSFQLCKNVNSPECEPIGSAEGYSASQLQEAMRKLNSRGYKVIAEDAGLVIGGTVIAFFGGWAWGVAVGGSEAGMVGASSAVFGGGVTFVGTSGAVLFMQRFNARKPFKEQKLLGVARGSTVEINYPIPLVAKDLAEVLK